MGEEEIDEFKTGYELITVEAGWMHGAGGFLKQFSLLLYPFENVHNKKFKTSYRKDIPTHYAGTLLSTSIKSYPKNPLEKIKLDVFSDKLIPSAF